jgi:hypothetical protein
VLLFDEDCWENSFTSGQTESGDPVIGDRVIGRTEKATTDCDSVFA